MKRTISVALLFFGFLTHVSAHPHMFIDSKVTFQFDETGLTGYWITWWFDGGFTAMILTDYDSDKNYTFSPTEVKDIENNAFSNLQNYGYFMHVYVDGIRENISSVTEFNAYMDDKQLVYTFFVPVNAPGLYDWRTVDLAIYDETFFCDIGFIENKPVSSRGYYAFEITSQLKKDSDTIITYDNTNISVDRRGKNYTGYANPTVATIQFRKK